MLMGVHWLIDPRVQSQFEAFLRSTAAPTAAECSKFIAEEEARVARRDGPRGLTVAGGTAEIRVEGLLMSKPSLMAIIFGPGFTTYREIVQGVAAAESDPSVKDISLLIDSPGGEVNGLFEAIDALMGANKPITSRIRNAHSAAFGLASAGQKLVALNAGSSVGSVGVVATYMFFSDVEEVHVTSSDSPDKRPDVRTEEGKAVIQKELDEIHDLFAGAIAKGRGVNKDVVNKEFGRGASFLAKEAQRRGMIDSIVRTPTRGVQRRSAAADGQEQQAMDPKDMTFEQFQAINPAAAAQGLELGRKQENERVCAHLDLAAESGAADVAIKAIRDGSSASAPAVILRHANASKHEVSAAARQAVSDSTEQRLESVGAAPEGQEAGVKFAAALKREVSGSAGGLSPGGEDLSAYLGAPTTGPEAEGQAAQ